MGIRSTGQRRESQWDKDDLTCTDFQNTQKIFLNISKKVPRVRWRSHMNACHRMLNKINHRLVLSLSPTSFQASGLRKMRLNMRTRPQLLLRLKRAAFWKMPGTPPWFSSQQMLTLTVWTAVRGEDLIHLVLLQWCWQLTTWSDSSPTMAIRITTTRNEYYHGFAS